jgi:hypothetical protein
MTTKQQRRRLASSHSFHLKGKEEKEMKTLRREMRNRKSRRKISREYRVEREINKLYKSEENKKEEKEREKVYDNRAACYFFVDSSC